MGGSLIHRLELTERNTYSAIIFRYLCIIHVNHYYKATIVFNGYDKGLNTKDSTHQKSGDKQGWCHKHDKICSWKKISSQIIWMNRHSLTWYQKKNCDRKVAMPSYTSVTIIGEDTELLDLLLYHATTDCKDLYFFQADETQICPGVVHSADICAEWWCPCWSVVCSCI